ncbi:MAG: hypothetical protein Q8K55_09840 [Gemmatimonadaceae bacterium]|nr:hypothetical protein [Gemmatimonadaceae bacterium]
MENKKKDTPPGSVHPTPGVRAPWSAPRLLRMGSVAALTSKVDNRGKNDGGKWPKRRT